MFELALMVVSLLFLGFALGYACAHWNLDRENRRLQDDARRC